MIEAVLVFLLAVVTSYWFLGACLFLLIFTDSDDADDTIFWPILAGLLIFLGVYLLRGLDWETTKWYFAGYIPVGIVWSMFKFRKYCTKQAKSILGPDFRNSSDITFTPSQKRDYDHYTSVSTLTGRISYWIAFWPLSIFSWAIRDLIVDVFDWLVNNVFRKVYEAIRNSAVRNVRVVDENKRTGEDRDNGY